MTKKIITAALFCGILWACSDNDGDDNGGPDSAVYYRVSAVTGHDSHWGEYRMRMVYHLETLDSIIVSNPSGDVICKISAYQTDNILTYYYMDIVANIDADSIASLVREYGEQGAKEHIPTVERTYRTTAITYDNDGVVTAQSFKYNRAPDDFGTGNNFKNQYLNDRRERYLYEYNERGEVLICRMFLDQYDEEDNQTYIRTIVKFEAAFDGSDIEIIEVYTGNDEYQSEESYLLADTYRFVYSGSLLQSVQGNALQIGYVYNGTDITGITRNGESVSYQYNARGLPSHVSYDNGDYMEITYEDGEGNFSHLYPILERAFNIPPIP